MKANADPLGGACQHPATRVYTWLAYDGTLCAACCDCGAVLAGAATAEESFTLDRPSPGLAAWFAERCGVELADRLRPGAGVWYWNQEQTGDGWVPATVTGWGGKDGCPVLDVTLANGWHKWGWVWQCVPGADMPAMPPAALSGATGPWP